jgi:hypothetical protein
MDVAYGFNSPGRLPCHVFKMAYDKAYSELGKCSDGGKAIQFLKEVAAKKETKYAVVVDSIKYDPGCSPWLKTHPELVHHAVEEDVARLIRNVFSTIINSTSYPNKHLSDGLSS